MLLSYLRSGYVLHHCSIYEAYVLKIGFTNAKLYLLLRVCVRTEGRPGVT